ncbi:hypothetical protein [Alteraurantiacibacter palmitatis]|uniref:Uncharacterized protein n=1 Tax=Alteraurantiacibacter palmitatis TaxID=2054628 RepID=A0ABV7EA61_9SPHN
MSERNSAHDDAPVAPAGRTLHGRGQHRQADPVRIMLALIGLAGAVGVLALNMGG